MLDPRPVGYVIGLLVLALGVVMGVPALVDIADGSANWRAFVLSSGVSIFFGALVALSCYDQRRLGLSIQQTFLLTTFAWVALPAFGCLPFIFGAPQASLADAVFEAVSGFTTTGSTAFVKLETLPRGVLLWRGMMQWFGGVGIIIFAMAFLPMLKVGGMQLFKSEAFDTFGKILPRAAEISQSIGLIYLGLTAACVVAYSAAGKTMFDSVVHAMTTISTGGFASTDASFGIYGAGAEYVAVVFMVLAALPFVRFVQLATGTARPLMRDTQIHTFLALTFGAVLALALFRWVREGSLTEEMFRDILFNLVSITTGTGYSSADYGLWGPFAVTLFFLMGLLGGCAGSTSCSIKVFRYQVLFAAISVQIQRLHSPNGVFTPRYAGRQIEEDVISSVMSFLFFFFVTFGLSAVTLSMIGLSPITAISGAATAVANIGPGLGPEIGPTGNFAGLPDAAKWVLTVTMLLGRLELLAVFVLFTPNFWRR
ncbi:MAG: TrkH family potassium uptake protein [Pikeienuella sp.]